MNPINDFELNNSIRLKNITSRLNGFNLLLILFLSYILLSVVYYFLGYLENIDNRINGIDSVYYYIYLPSIIIDFDLNFTNELQQLYPLGAEQLTQTGLPRNNFSIGPALFWLPAFLLAHFTTLLLQLFGVELTANGLSSIYQLFVYLANSIYGFIGILLISSILKLYVDKFTALITSLAIMLATPITYYLWSASAMSHNVSLFSTALYLYLILTRGPSKLSAVAASLMVLARWQNIIFLLPLLFLFINQIYLSISNKDPKWKAIFIKNLVFGGLFLIGLLPQLLVWKILFGDYLLMPQGSGFISFADLPLLSILFSNHHGLFSWHPILLFSFCGLFLFWKKNKLLTISLISTFIFQWLLNSAVDDWWSGWSFGNRRFISALPFLALGLGFLLYKLKNKYLFATAITTIILLTIWNQLFIFQYKNFLIPRGETITQKQMFHEKFNLIELNNIKKQHLAALQALSNQNVFESQQIARDTYKNDKNNLNSIKIFGITNLITNNINGGVEVFNRWNQIEPDHIVAKLALAELLMKKKQMQQAINLLKPTNCPVKHKKLCSSSINKIKNKETILNDQFWILYRDTLDRVYNY